MDVRQFKNFCKVINGSEKERDSEMIAEKSANYHLVHIVKKKLFSSLNFV